MATVTHTGDSILTDIIYLRNYTKIRVRNFEEQQFLTESFSNNVKDIHRKFKIINRFKRNFPETHVNQNGNKLLCYSAIPVKVIRAI